jgi:hypothetical protein
MMLELWTRKSGMVDEDENDMEDTSGYDKAGVRSVLLGVEDLISVMLPARSELVLAISGMVN